MNRLKIATVCGFGVGSSLVLKMQIDDVLRKLGVDAEVTPCDITSVTGENCQIIFTSEEFAIQLRQTLSIPVVEVRDFLNKEYLGGVVTAALREHFQM